ncbi:alpha/beta fold hydrolase [Caulobacter sp. RHG1]|uniref:alpha/beta fold hydrolase n=1 Tax=Caulobacter sp. (strain RHG1) TaxID=2545762 RepID=UPI001553420D|nr:alpha/beta fold hydrolase [Caulobacter sp. RHG1]NQE60806.1 proline imino-peptidase [Caulobacter sp. RHG1]
MKRFGIIAAALIALSSPAAAFAAETASPSLACRAGQAVDEARFVQIGGIQQWMTISGRDCANPVLLIVHGGPGNPNTPFAQSLFGDWTKDFTVIQWDQRGSGKTYGANKPAEGEALTMDRLTQDGVEVARYVRAHLGKRKVILMGGSWGSALAVNMAMAAPDLFHAYVGTGQLANYQDDVRVGYAKTLDLARAAGDADSVGKLEALGAPPWTNPRAFGILRRVGRKYEALATEPPPKGWFAPAPGYDTPAYEANYEAGEDYSFLQFVGLAGDGMGPKIDLRQLGTRFAMPVYLLQGEVDLVTPLEVSRAYFDDIAAPKKEFIPLARTGHDPNRTMLDAQLDVLQTRVRAEAMAGDAGGAAPVAP